MSLTTFVGNRISLKRDRGKPSAGVLIAVTGIAVSFIIMLIAISVVSGFKDEIVKKLESFNAQISIHPPHIGSSAGTSFEPLTMNRTIERAVREAAPEATLGLSISQPAVFKTDSAFQGIVLKGIKSADDWTFVGSILSEGTLPGNDTMAVVMSRLTASALNIRAGDGIMTHFFDGNNLRSRRLRVSGIYDSHFKDFDGMMAFTPLPMLQGLFGLDSTAATAVEIRGLKLDDVPGKTRAIHENLLRSALDPEVASDDGRAMIYGVDNIFEECAMYINWLNLLDTNVVVILTLMAFVAGFTLVSSLFIIILEKVNMIGLFKALGATDIQIRRIFIYLAQRLVVRGLLIGNLTGVSLILIQRHTHLLPLDPDAYYLNFVPMDFSLPALILLNVGVIAVSACILIVPTCLISSLSPVRTLKYE